MSGPPIARGRAKRRREPVYLRVTPQGTFEPASALYSSMLRDKKFRVGDVVRAELTRPRYPKHHRLVMGLLQRVLENMDGLQTIEQLLSVIKVKLGRAQPLIDTATGRTYWQLESIAFDAMDQGEFEVFWRDLCRLVSRDYFPGMPPERVAELAEMMEEA